MLAFIMWIKIFLLLRFVWFCWHDNQIHLSLIFNAPTILHMWYYTVFQKWMITNVQCVLFDVSCSESKCIPSNQRIYSDYKILVSRVLKEELRQTATRIFFTINHVIRWEKNIGKRRKKGKIMFPQVMELCIPKSIYSVCIVKNIYLYVLLLYIVFHCV